MMMGKNAMLLAVAIIAPTAAIRGKQVSSGDRTAIRGGLMNKYSKQSAPTDLFKRTLLRDMTSIFCEDDEPSDEPDKERTDEPTRAPVDDSTEASVEKPTEASVDDSTNAPVEEPTKSPIYNPTEYKVTWDEEGGDIFGMNSRESIGTAVAISSDGEKLVIGGNEVLRFYYVVSGEWTMGMDLSKYLESGYATALSLSSNGLFLIVGERSLTHPYAGTVRTFKQAKSTWKGHGELVGDEDGDDFGYSVAISGDGGLIMIGAMQTGNSGTGYVNVYEQADESSIIQKDVSGTQDGSVDSSSDENTNIFETLGNPWVLTKHIPGTDTDLLFGSSVAVSSDGNKMIIGAPCSDNSKGSVYVYSKNNDDSGARAEMLDLFVQTISGEAGDNFGSSVAMSDDGSRFAVLGISININVKIFEFNSNTARVIGQPIIILASSGINSRAYLSEGCNFSAPYITSLALSGDGSRLAVGSTLDNDGGSRAGKVFMYAIDKNGWKDIGEIAGEAYGDYSGFSVALSKDGKMFADGAPLNAEAQEDMDDDDDEDNNDENYNDFYGRTSGQVKVFKSSGGD